MNKIVIHSPLRKWKKGQMPISPFINLSVGSDGISRDHDILISSQLATDQEIDYAVNNLIKELEKLRNEAKKELAFLHRKMLS